jgi:putative aldouronate transport system substrate-binding protein
VKSKGRLLCFSIAVVMLVGVFAMHPGISNAVAKKGAAFLNLKGFPIVKQPITLKIFIKKPTEMGNPNEMLVFQEYEKKTGIKIDWLSVDSDSASEKMALSLASGDLPDVFMKTGMGKIDQLKYGSQGLLVDLNKGLLQKYAPNAKKFIDAHPDVKKCQTMADGAIYSLPEGVESPALRLARKLFINAAWLKKVGKKMPTTTAEFYDVLKAFKEKDPNGNGKADEIPLTGDDMGNIIDSLRGCWGLGNRGIIPDRIDLDEKTGKVRYIPVTPQWRDFLTYMHKLYQEGLLDKEIFTSNMAQFIGKGTEGVVGAFSAPNTACISTNHADEFVGIPTPLQGPKNIKPICAAMRPYVLKTGTFVVTRANKYPEATMRWIDYFYTNAGTLLYHYGIEGKTFKKTANGKYDWSDAIYKEAAKPGAVFDNIVGKYVPYVGGANPTVDREPYFGDRELEPVSYKAALSLIRFAPKQLWPEFTYTLAENEKLVTLKTDINGYVKKMQAEFVFGTTPLSKWDDYVNQIRRMGLDEMLKIHQAAYQRYLKK